ncbi:hypothetical protein [Vibrio sp. MA40-2]|uniref:hypothetical protein n=1 Tax=Vibrio sp. MA40-2 TaxID=3391828 RepID=UPI0039A69231
MHINNKILLIISLVGLIFGGYFAIEEWFIRPSFSTNDTIIWTLPLISYIFLALSSTGVSIVYAYGSLKHVDGIEANKLTLIGLALGLLVGAFASLATEMGSPLHIFWLVFSPNFLSPIWWMGTLYSIELLLLFVKLTMMLLDKHSSLDTILTYATLIVAVTASLVLGSVFGTVIGREGYSGIDASVLTFICALSSGVAMILLISKNKINRYYLSAARWTFGILTLFIMVKWIYLTRAHVLEEPQWLQVISILGIALAWLLIKYLPKLSASFVLASIFSIELAFVIQGQLFVLGPKTTWFGKSVEYSANIAEIGVLVLGVSIAVIAYNLIVQGLPYLRSRKIHN